MALSISSLCNPISSRFSHPTMPHRLLSDPSLHTIYGYLTGSLLALVELKYQETNTSPFNDHPAVMLLFLAAIIVYDLALLVCSLRSNHQINLILIVWMCHISGSVACELLLLLLVSPIWCFIIHLSSLLLLLTFLFFCHYPMLPDAQSAERQATEPNLEAGTSAEGQATEPDPEARTTPNVR